jgi:ribosomal protein S18 acetylase RimI-like enzyme
MRVVPAESDNDIKAARTLFSEYASSIGFDLSFQNFQSELANLPGEYAPPDGTILFALEGNDIAGCVALRRLDSETCEMKRLYVRPEFRDKGIGKTLSIAVIEEARKRGYRRMRLDTMPSMRRAILLYSGLGFREIKPYRFNPQPGALFFELAL